MKPTFIGLGAQKCASSWLYRIFDDHPEAFVSSPKELNFFSSHFERGYQWYENHFQAAASRSAIGEISPSYFADGDAPARAHLYSPGFLILLALRDPIERAYSNFLHDVRLGYYKSATPTFESAIENNPMYVGQSLYARHLDLWLKHFPKKQMMFVLQEEIRNDPLGQASRVYEFLRIGTVHVSDAIGRAANESYVPKHVALESFTRASGDLARRMGVGSLVRIASKSSLASAFRRYNRTDIRALVPPMLESTRARLQAIFAEDTKRLAVLIGRQSLPWKTWRDANGVLAAT